MFDIGFSELFVIAIVALVVLGPKRLPRAAKFAGVWVRRARAQWHSVRSDLERELADEELRRSLRQAHEEVVRAEDALFAGGRSLQRDLARASQIPIATSALPASVNASESHQSAPDEARPDKPPRGEPCTPPSGRSRRPRRRRGFGMMRTPVLPPVHEPPQP
ncbi:Sec-independent protein translocase protein TatB [Novilysobacter spongiicola]|uniref:Sec-independent protein translocase protein TatB n=1 Tax=Novilysobacter spongiicola TaxID=435289 RepID=UPI000999F186|nr:Sec-independent protein translocase protein TatB [Lysobacter spongiicola]